MESTAKISTFKETLNRIDKEIECQNSCISTLTIVAIAMPFIIWLLLFFIKPSFVKNELNERSTKKVVTWTVILTAISWAILFGYSYFTGNIGSLACLAVKN
jgi:heme/copper-type cytochrome/quinol oxidase subunit 2